MNSHSLNTFLFFLRSLFSLVTPLPRVCTDKHIKELLLYSLFVVILGIINPSVSPYHSSVLSFGLLTCTSIIKPVSGFHLYGCQHVVSLLFNIIISVLGFTSIPTFLPFFTVHKWKYYIHYDRLLNVCVTLFIFTFFAFTG